MTASSRANLKSRFQTGDKPTGSDFADLIDSSVNLLDTEAQTLSGPLTVSNAQISTLGATQANIILVSATTVNADTVTADTASFSTGYIQTLSGQSAFFDTLTVDTLNYNPVVEIAFAQSSATTVAVSGASFVTNSNTHTLSTGEGFSVSGNIIEYTGGGSYFSITADGVISTTSSAFANFAIIVNGSSRPEGRYTIPVSDGARSFTRQSVVYLANGDEVNLGVSLSATTSANVTIGGYSILIRRA